MNFWRRRALRVLDHPFGRQEIGLAARDDAGVQLVEARGGAATLRVNHQLGVRMLLHHHLDTAVADLLVHVTAGGPLALGVRVDLDRIRVDRHALLFERFQGALLHDQAEELVGQHEDPPAREGLHGVDDDLVGVARGAR